MYVSQVCPVKRLKTSQNLGDNIPGAFQPRVLGLRRLCCGRGVPRGGTRRSGQPPGAEPLAPGPPGRGVAPRSRRFVSQPVLAALYKNSGWLGWDGRWEPSRVYLFIYIILKNGREVFTCKSLSGQAASLSLLPARRGFKVVQGRIPAPGSFLSCRSLPQRGRQRCRQQRRSLARSQRIGQNQHDHRHHPSAGQLRRGRGRRPPGEGGQPLQKPLFPR